MATFQAQVEGLTSLSIDGSSAPTQTELAQFLTDGAKEIINILPPQLKVKCMSVSILNNSFPTLDMDDEGSISHVTRLSADSSGYYIPCRQIPAMYGDLSNDSTSIHYATVTDPVYWIDSNTSDASTLFVKPTATSVQTAKVYHISYPVFDTSGAGNNVDIDDANDISIPNFPNEAEYLVVLYGAMKSLLNAIGNITMPPTVAGASESLTTTIDATTSNQLGTEDDWSNYSKWFQALGEMIEDDEDIELAGAQIQKIATYLNSYSIQLQGDSAKMQKYMQIFQTLKADYTSGVSILASGGLPQPQKEGR